MWLDNKDYDYQFKILLLNTDTGDMDNWERGVINQACHRIVSSNFWYRFSDKYADMLNRILLKNGHTER